jgi:radical SAM superfamily enzyme YgiQ (UPF0313 family)
MTRVGLVSLYTVESNGIRYLAAALRQAGIPTDECYVGYHLHRVRRRFEPQVAAQLVDHMRARGVGLVGISLRTGALLQLAIELTRTLKRELGVPVVWGGAHVSMAPDDCLDHADYLVLGEGEAAICELARKVLAGESARDVPNVWTKVGGQVHKTALRLLVDDLDALPFPDYHSHQDKYWFRDGSVYQGEPLARAPSYRVVVTRGCPRNCSFCGVSAFRKLYHGQGHFYRRRSVENAIQELESVRRVCPSIRRIRFDDELFVPEHEWIEEFCREYPRRVGLPFDIVSSPQDLDDWTIDALAEAGLDQVYLGIQSSSTANRWRYGRGISDEDVVRCISRLHARRVYPAAQILIDDPEASETEKRELLELLLRLPRPFDLYIFSLCHYPGSATTRRLLASGTISKDEVEGANDKGLRQYIADFSYPRSDTDRLLLALYMLSNKRGVPRAGVRFLASNRYLNAHPGPVVAAAGAVNLGKLVVRGTSALVRGELSWLQVRQWLGDLKGWSSLPI